jgi:glycosyltransferase involved in cell wall biosynthesis
MRVLAAIHGPVYGGAQAQLIRLRRPLADRGVEVVALVPPGTGAERLREGGVETVTMPIHRLRATPDPRVQAPFVASLPREIGAIRRLVRDLDIDVVQAHGPTNPHAALAADREQRAVVWQIYDTVAPMWLRRLTMPMVVRVADAITTWGMGLARSHPGTLRLGDRHIAVFPPVDAGEFEADGRREAARRELGVPDGAVAIGNIGNLNPTKGHDKLVRAVAMVREQRPEAVVRIMGAHSPPHAAYEEGVRREAAERGLVDPVLRILDPGQRVPELLPGIDVFAMSSVPRSEGIPTVLLEAMACGLPVVTTDVGAVRELVEHGVTGFIVPPERPAELAAALLELVRDPGLRARMGAEGRRQARDRYGLERNADLHARAYELAVEHRRSRR